MSLTSKRPQRPARPPDSTLIPAGPFLVCLLLAVVAWPPGLRADDEKPPSDNEQADRAPSPQPSPSPAPSAARPPAPRPSATPERKPAPRPRPAPTPEPVLRFTDDDLERFHREAPQAEDDEEEGAVGPAAGEPAAGDPAPGGAQIPAGPAPRAPKPRPAPKPAVEAPAQDPLKPFKDREAQEKFRQMQIETGRERIAKIQARLDYLKAKRDALSNPAPLLVGSTRAPANPGNPVAGPGKVPIGGFFPAIPPPQTDEDRENDRKLKVKDLLEQVETEIKSVEEELEIAQAELASVQTRFAQESQSR